MNVQYQELCKVEFKHSYYADGNLKEFNLNPTSATQNKMQRDIVYRQMDGALVLYTNRTNSVNTVNLHFSLNLQHPLFFNFTAITLEKNKNDKVVEVSGEKKYFFSNSNAIDGVIPMEECRLVDTRFEVKFNTANESTKKLQLLNPGGNLIYEKEITQEKTHLVDVSENVSSPGIYQLIFDGQQIEQLFITSAIQEYRGMGILEVDLSKGKNYSIQLESRHVYFRYNFMLNEEQKNATFKIKGNDGQPIAYEQQEEKTLPNGQTSTPILLQERIALAERPTETLLLEMETSGNTISIPLPFAVPNTLQRLETNSQSEAYVAEIYVYL